MHTKIKSMTGLTAACLACAAPAAFALANSASAASPSAKPPAGTSYAATTQFGGLQIVVSRDRRQVRTALFAYKQPCSDGDVLYDYDQFAAIPISANRTFKFSRDSGPIADAMTPGATYRYTQAFNGTVNKAGTKIVGTAKSTYAYTNPAGLSYTCDTGTVAFKAAD